MKRILFLPAMIVCMVAWAQVRITSFDSSGELSWTSSVFRGFYNVEWSDFPTGPWTTLDLVADLDVAKTNRIMAQVPVTNTQGFYRVAWLPPNVTGVWDYKGYELGVLVVTGQLSLVTGNLLGTNPAVYRVHGSCNLSATGQSTNGLSYLWPLTGTGVLTGPLDFHYARLTLWWPTNCIDCQVFLSGDLGPNTYTGGWSHVTFAPPRGGRFNAVKIASTNSINKP